MSETFARFGGVDEFDQAPRSRYRRGLVGLSLRQLVAMLEADDGSCIIIHPCRYPKLFSFQLRGTGEEDGWFHVIGIARLDIADEPSYRQLLAALEYKSDQFTRETLYIEF